MVYINSFGHANDSSKGLLETILQLSRDYTAVKSHGREWESGVGEKGGYGGGEGEFPRQVQLGN